MLLFTSIPFNSAPTVIESPKPCQCLLQLTLKQKSLSLANSPIYQNREMTNPFRFRVLKSPMAALTILS